MDLEMGKDVRANICHCNNTKPEQLRAHSALTRTISQPPNDGNVPSLVLTLIESIDNMNIHRKLERTQSEPLPQQANTSRYKTELCRPYEEAGECKYGEKCQFAHGFHELRSLHRHPKYKTEYCRTYHSVGFCPYGPRCHFVHNVEEVRSFDTPQLNSLHNNAANLQNCVHVPTGQHKSHQKLNRNVSLKHSLPLSPPLSMSTESDRESPTESISLSPTNSIKNVIFSDQILSSMDVVFNTAFPFVSTPPGSPNTCSSPAISPPPYDDIRSYRNVEFMGKPKQVIKKCVSSPPFSMPRPNKKNLSRTVSIASQVDESRLPVFTQLRAALETLPNVA